MKKDIKKELFENIFRYVELEANKDVLSYLIYEKHRYSIESYNDEIIDFLNHYKDSSMVTLIANFSTKFYWGADFCETFESCIFTAFECLETLCYLVRKDKENE